MEEKNSSGEVLHEGHRKRIKERYREKGIAALDDKDIIELILTYAIPRKDVYTIARGLVHEFGSAEGVLKADPAALRERANLTDHTVTLIKLIDDLRTKPARFVEYRREKLTSVLSAVEYCHKILGDFPEEAVIELFLDDESCVVELNKVSYGEGDSAVLPVDSILENARRMRVKSIVVAHNHPSGSSAPSAADLMATEVLQKALSSHGIDLLEHVIVAKNECTALIHHQTIGMRSGEAFAPWRE